MVSLKRGEDGSRNPNQSCSSLAAPARLERRLHLTNTAVQRRPRTYQEMQARKKWHVLLGMSFLLVTSGHCANSKDSTLEERRTMQDAILEVFSDNQGARSVTRRNSGHLYTVGQDYKFSRREKGLFIPRLDSSRPLEIVQRDVNLKDKFIKHFTGPVKFSSECNRHFHRLYHNTRDCSTPAYYKRCARLLTRLALSPLCAHS
ncbi:ALK and LTK ligand 1 isoform X2 [Erpetoichthys calabaricus]|uniref:ALK and LTK ligand 1 isoform X2 n=1 Tax=Erpetoichthys calabaricus TaxID=27687 RepID=UPI00223473D3|nr:ALK and LTK ligand 1 isoform X2 [Erpetoichthys calabaricus]